MGGGSRGNGGGSPEREPKLDKTASSQSGIAYDNEVAAENGESEDEGTEDESDDEGTESKEELPRRCPEKTKASAMVYGWDKNLRLGFRSQMDNPQCKTLAKPVQIDKDANDTDGVVIEFDDGEKAQLAEMTVGCYKTVLKRGSTPACLPPWTGETHDTHHKLTMSQRHLCVKQWKSFVLT